MQDQFDYIYVATGAKISKAVMKTMGRQKPSPVSGLLMLKKVILADNPDGGKKVPRGTGRRRGQEGGHCHRLRPQGEERDEAMSMIAIGNGGALSFSLHMGWKNLSGMTFDNKTVVTTEKIKYDYLEKPRV